MKQVVAAMIDSDAEGLQRQWCERLAASVWAPKCETDDARRRLVAELLRNFGRTIARDQKGVPHAPRAGVEGWISGSKNPRVETAYWIGVLSIGRDVIEEYLSARVFPRLKLGGRIEDEILDELEAAFRLLTHQHIQHVCEWFLHATSPGTQRAGAAVAHR